MRSTQATPNIPLIEYDLQRVADHPLWSNLYVLPGDDGCWLWTGGINENGYGQITFEGFHGYTHRLAYKLTKGKIPRGKNVCHECDVRQCCRPKHLIADTQLGNVQAAIKRGRARWPERIPQPTHAQRTRGEQHHSSKLTEDQVLEARQLWADGTGMSIRALARQYGVSKVTMGAALRGLTWGHVW